MAPGRGLSSTSMSGAGTKIVAALLIVVMAVGSVAMWLVVPFGWIWVVSHQVSSSQPSMGSYVLLLFAIPLSMFAIGKLLGRVNRFYGEVTKSTPETRVHVPWLRSMRGERDAGTPRSVLDVVMVCSVTVALVLFGLWFFLLAGSSMPT
jgi:hypothetical protein